MSTIRNAFLQGVFDRAAGTYTSVGPGYFNYFGERLIDLLKIKQGDSVLDIASGRGASLFPAADVVGKAGKITGIDFSEGMVLETKRVIKTNGYENIELLQMDAENLNFDQSVFDIAACGLSIQFFTDYKKSVNEMYRVLKPGGKVGISAWKRKESKPGVIARVVPKYLPANGQNVPPPPPNRPDFGDEQFLEDMLGQAGFKNIKIINERRMFFYKDFEEFWQEQWSHGGRATFETIEKHGAERLQSFKNELFDEFTKEYGQDEIPFDANVLVATGKKGD